MKFRNIWTLLLLLLVTAPVYGQSDMAGEWMVTFATPRGPQEFTMYVIQEGPRLSGRLINEAGEFPLRGRMDGSEFTITWQFPDGGQLVDITFAGKVEGDSLTGTAKLGNTGRTGSLTGTRTGQ